VDCGCGPLYNFSGLIGRREISEVDLKKPSGDYASAKVSTS